MTSKLAVFGNPIAHSRSPEIHARFGTQCGIDLSYEKILVPDEAFDETAADFFAQPGAVGINVTVPCKMHAWRYVNEASIEADAAQAVNTIGRQSDGRLVGYNTDGQGLVRDLQQNLGWEISGKRVLVLGAGGAVSGVLASLLAQGPDVLHLHNRTRSKADALAQRFGESVQVEALDELDSAYDIIVNGTSASLGGHEIALPASIVSSTSHCYDMVYNSEVTPFNRWCLEQAACTVADGLGMLVEQAAAAFEIWFEVRPETDQILTQLRTSL